MKITLCRYIVEGANWSPESVDESFLDSIVKAMMDLPLRGDKPEEQYGFVQCKHYEKIIYGLFAQKFPTISIDYDPKTKKQKKQKSIDSGTYLIVFRPGKNEIYIQNKRSSDLPSTSQIAKKLADILKLALSNTDYMFSKLTQAQDEVDREHVVKIFYEEADEILEMEFSDFDPLLIEEEKKKRGGKIQTYFNPREEYQEGMEEAAIKIANNAEKASIKSKKGASLKKDPITRAMLEASRRPNKIVYKKEEEKIIDSAVTKKKEIISIEGNELNLENQAQVIEILQKLFSRGMPVVKKRVIDQGGQERLFE